MTTKIGTKSSISLLGIPNLVYQSKIENQNYFLKKKFFYFLQCAWLLMIFGRQVEYLYVSRILMGIVGGGIYQFIYSFKFCSKSKSKISQITK